MHRQRTPPQERLGMKLPVNPDVTSFIGSAFIRALGVTWRIEWRGLDHMRSARIISPQTVFAFWHGRLLVLSFTHRNRRVQVLASEHPDGDIMGRTITWLGFGHLKGSTTRGGAKALRDLSSVLKQGFDVGLTIDGPKGPRGVVQQGAIELSRMTGAVIVPVSNAARPRYLFDSWDRFQLPYPFARIVVAYGEPLLVPGDADREERERCRVLLQQRLRELTGELDGCLGYHGSKVWPHEDH
jgi:lysophospholipid acyltransferase (LPLAT)-like uncharacterized protein